MIRPGRFHSVRAQPRSPLTRLAHWSPPPRPIPASTRVLPVLYLLRRIA